MPNYLTKYKSYESDSAYVYPASNRCDGGEDNSELNLKLITDKFAIKGFIVKRRPDPNPEYLGMTITPDSLKIERGECSIGGYYLNLKEITVTSKELSLDRSTKYNILIVCVLDASGLLSGDGRDIVGTQTNKVVCRGVRVQLMTDELLETLDKRYPYLLLGTVSTDVEGNFDPDTLKPDDMRYSFIDSKTILTETGIPIEVWVMNQINYGLTHLSQLNYYINENDENSSAVFKIVPVYDESGNLISLDAVFERKTNDENQYPKKISISEIEQRTRVSLKDQYVDLPDLNINELGSTYNGTSSRIAREDHSHDSRYVHKMEGESQEVKTEIQFNKKVTTKDGIKGDNFNIDNDGSASFGSDETGSTTIGNGAIKTSGNITSNGEVRAKKVYNAVWNDIAELYLKNNPDREIPVGTLISKVPGVNAYEPTNEKTMNLVVGICSGTYGYLLGGEGNTEEDLKKYIPVALSGRVPVKVIKGAIINEGDLLVSSAIEGRATSCTFRGEQYGRIVGKALESSDGSKDVILCQVMLG